MRVIGLALGIVTCGSCLAAAETADYQPPTFTSANLVNAATGQTVLAPNSICALYGTNFFLDGSAASNSMTAVPSTLGGITVLIGGTPAGVLFISANQINLLIPNSLTPSTYSIRVVRDGLSSQAVQMVLQEVAPGLFALSPGIAAAQHADGTMVTAQSPAVPGEVVVFYGTGFGRAQPDPSGLAIPFAAAPIVHAADFQMTLDDVAVDSSLVQYVGVAPFNGGLYQVNIRMPDNLPATNPEVRVSIAGVVSPGGLRLITALAGIADLTGFAGLTPSKNRHARRRTGDRKRSPVLRSDSCLSSPLVGLRPMFPGH